MQANCFKEQSDLAATSMNIWPGCSPPTSHRFLNATEILYYSPSSQVGKLRLDELI